MISRLFESIRTMMSVRADNPPLLEAQYRTLSRQLPLMYLVLLINTWALAATHLFTAPTWLTVGIPAVMTIVCISRVAFWIVHGGRQLSHTEILNALQRTNRLAVFIAGGFAAWSLSLFPYGDAYAQAHVAFYMGITVIVCIFCLMQLRPAALTATFVVNVAFVVFFSSTGNPTFIATALNIFLVSIAMLIVLNNHYHDFTRLVDMQVRSVELSNQNWVLANEDSLTGLPNRRMFFATLEQEMAKAKQDQTTVTVGVLDLDGFKSVNDLYGHGAGDSLLMAVGRRLQPIPSSRVLLARLGGDEFAFICSGSSDPELSQFADSLLAEFKAPFHVIETPIQIGATIGICVYPNTAGTAAELYEYADYALYQGKRRRPGTVCVFSETHRAQLKREAMVEHALRKATYDDELYVVFQPILDCKTGITVAFEALARWRSPALGEVSPAQFIPVAERTGLIGALTLPLLKKALQTARYWPAPIRLSFNLSAHDVGSMEQVRQITNMIISHEFDPDRVDFEITETAIVLDIDQAQRAVEEFRSLGCGVSLDDFGTGYSSLSQLHALALSKLKVDRSFVTDIHLKPASYKIVKSLVILAQDMGLDCVIEGVETNEEMDALKRLGCSQVQGYLFSRPMSAEQTKNWLASA
jgi:diguanylate cyclase (GGDEF)-like protein